MKSVLGLLLNKRAMVQDRASYNWAQKYVGGRVILEKDAQTGIATICLDQPKRKNAMTGYMMCALDDAVTTLETWSEGKGLIVYGSDHNFCSGGDKEFVKQILTPTGASSMSSYMQSILLRLKKLPLLSVALVEGAGALGGGAEIAISCDWRLLTPECSGIGFVHRRMGIAPAWGGGTWLVQAVGYQTALDLMATGRLVTGQEAINMGLANNILTSNNPLLEAHDWLKQRTCGPAEVVRAIKQIAINVSVPSDVERILDEEKNLFSPLWGGPANLKALEAKIKHRL